jgi:putative isomerase
MDNLRKEVIQHGKEHWKPMLQYLAELHIQSVFPPRQPFAYEWENIGPGYCYGPAFGHWDIVHAVLDIIPFEPQHARHQLLNNLSAQQPDGRLPGSIWMGGSSPEWDDDFGHPPLWPIAVQDYVELTNDQDLITKSFQPLLSQINWFENKRKANPDGFYYADIVTGTELKDRYWESGVDEGIRFDQVPLLPLACVDATSHVYGLYSIAVDWAQRLGIDPSGYSQKAESLKQYIQKELFVNETGFFHDSWWKNQPDHPFSFEGIWPLVVRAATPEQARRVVEDNLLNADRFYTDHPIATVSTSDPHFELRMWRGPVWNSMTYWAARGCLRYGYSQAAKDLLERALDKSADQFSRTGTIWEFYHPFAGDQKLLIRKPHTEYNHPCRDYIGHNPLIAMTLLYESI